MGEKGSGKTTLISLFLNQLGMGEMKETAAVEYLYAKKSTGIGKKGTGHIYEIGGGRNLSNICTIPLENDNIVDSFCVIMFDLSQCSTLFETIQYWIKHLRKKIDEIMTGLSLSNQFGLEKIQSNVAQTWENHEDL